MVDADNYDATKDNGAGYTFTYDTFGRIREVRDAYGQLCEGSEYDSAGRLKKNFDCTGLLVKNQYDLGGRKTAVYDTEDTPAVQTYTYDSMGNITGITDGEQNHTEFELDAWGRIVTLKAPDGSVETYTYDCAGNITSTTDGNGNTITYAYNSMQKLGSVTDQAGEADTFTYDGEGNLTVHTDRNGRGVTSTYGSFGLLLSETAEDGTFNCRKYDTQGRLIENASSHVVYRYDYTKAGKIRTKYVNGKAALTYSYTRGGKVAGITDVSGKTTGYTYDLNGNLTCVTEAGKVLATYEYDEISRIRKISFANGVTTEYTYDSGRNMASLTTTGKDGNTLLSYSYRYDRNGNRVDKKDNVKENHTTYVYDSMQRLCEVTYPEAGKETYTYDAVGNRVEKKVRKTAENPAQEYTEQYRYDERNRLTEKSVWENGASAPTDTTTYTYDAQGSLLREQGTDFCRKYLYNDFHQCIGTEVIRGREEEAERILQENRYDGEGLRFSLIENGKRTDFITNGWDNLAELDENGQVTKRIIRGMGIVASEDVEVSSNATEATGNTIGATGNIIDATSAFAGTSAYHYYHGNERMDVEYITDEVGQVVNGYTYDAFGTIVTSSEKLQNRYTYNGEAFDKTTEQYYLRKRFYNPKLSRFLQEDEYRGDGLNLYAFCANNPVMYVDPSGYYKQVESTNSDVMDIIERTTRGTSYSGSVPTNNAGFDAWYNALSSTDLKTLYSDVDVAKMIKSRLRGDGGVHEWLMVAEAPKTKTWGVTSEMIKSGTTSIEQIKFVNIKTKKYGVQSGRHGNQNGEIEASVSATAHLEIQKMIRQSGSLEEFSNKLRKWSNEHLEVTMSDGTVVKGEKGLPELYQETEDENLSTKCKK